MEIIKWGSVTETEEIPPFGEELERHLESRNVAVKHASCSAWNLLFQTLLENGLPVSTVSITDIGKPYFLNSNIYFSISHSHGICAVAVADRPVGVDVEIIKTTYPPHMIERSLTIAEQDSFDGDFTRTWCRKEAVAKMTGEGITGYPNNIDTTEYKFIEQQIEHAGQKYWLVAVSIAALMVGGDATINNTRRRAALFTVFFIYILTVLWYTVFKRNIAIHNAQFELF